MKYFTLIFVVLSLTFVACDRESSIGASLLGEDNIEISFTDTLTLEFKNQYTDSLRTFGSDGLLVSSPNNYRIGRIEDPVFGVSEQRLILCPNLLNTPNFDGAILDSMILIIPLDSISAYGDLNTRHNISVYQLDNIIHNTDVQGRMDTFYTTDWFEPNTANLIGELSQTINYEDSIQVYNPSLDDTFVDIPQLRIKIDDSFASQWLDTMNVPSDTTFQENFRGMILTSEPDDPSFLGMSILNLSSATTDARLRVYYREDTLKTFYDYYLAGFKHNPILHEYSGSMVDDAINSDNNENLFIQATGGTFVSLDLSGLDAFDGKGINYAELELTVNADIAGDDLSLYQPSFNILAIYEDDDGTKLVVSDLTTLNADAFGGLLRDEVDEFGNPVKRYTLKITDHVVKIKNGTITNPVIELVAQEPLEVPRRVVLHGNDMSPRQAKLKLVVSEP